MRAIALALSIAPALTFGQTVRIAYHTLHAAKKGDYESKVKYPSFAGRGVSGFATKIWKHKATSGFRKFLKDAKDFRAEETKNKFNTGEYYYDGSPKITIRETGLISGYFAMDSYMGGAHGMQWFEPINVGIVDGKPSLLHLRDILMAGADP